MKKKLIFSSLIFPIALLIFLNGAAFAQKVNPLTMFENGVNNSNVKAIELNDLINKQFEILSVSNADQSLYSTDIKTNEDNHLFTDLNRKYYWKVINNKAGQNASGNAFSSESLTMKYNSLSVNTFSTLESINQIGNKDYFLQLSKKNNTTGWVLLGCGTAMFIGGVIVGSSSTSLYDETFEIGSFMILGGLIADVVSIPFFITAHKHKKRAMSLSFGNQNIPFQKDNGNQLHSQLAVSLKIKL